MDLAKRDLGFYVNVAELISAVAIVVSLVYATWEFRRSDELNSSEINALLYERGSELDQIIIGNREFAEVYEKAMADEPLTSLERLQFLRYQNSFLDQWEMAWDYHEQGILAEEVWKSWDQWYAQETRSAPLWSWLENRKNYTGEAFRAHVEGVLEFQE